MSRCKSVPTRLRYHPCLSRCDDQGSGIDPSLVSAGRGRLLLADVDHEVITISHGNQPDGGWAWQRNLGICSARGVARRLTGGSVAQGLTSWIGGGGGEGALFLLFGPYQVPEGRTRRNDGCTRLNVDQLYCSRFVSLPLLDQFRPPSYAGREPTGVNGNGCNPVRNPGA